MLSKVIFNVFSDDDRETYAAALGDALSMRPSDRSTSIDRIAEWLERSTRVLIGAGAGLSVAAGLDYTDEKSFARTTRDSGAGASARVTS